MLYGGGSTGGQNDPYKTAVIDTIVAEIQSVPGEDRCVLLLGYKDQMVEMFQVIRLPSPPRSRTDVFDDRRTSIQVYLDDLPSKMRSTSQTSMTRS